MKFIAALKIKNIIINAMIRKCIGSPFIRIIHNKMAMRRNTVKCNDLK